MQNRPSATMRLIELAERLTPSGEIGDGLVNQFHEAATLARLEQQRLKGAALALQENDPHEPVADNGMTVLDAVRGDLAALVGLMARLEQNPADVLAHLASSAGRVVDPERHQAMRDYCEQPVPLELTPCKGSWSKCPNARQALQADGPMAGAPIMRCARTGQHPDDCVR